MEAGDLVKFTFAKTSNYINKENKSRIAVLVSKEALPVGSWIILLESGSLMHGRRDELEVISESGCFSKT